MSNQTPRRVNIQFSIELDELPAEVSRLLQKSSDHLSEASKTYSNIGRNDNNLTSETWGEIDNIRGVKLITSACLWRRPIRCWTIYKTSSQDTSR
jgi:hypothetical protein